MTIHVTETKENEQDSGLASPPLATTSRYLHILDTASSWTCPVSVPGLTMSTLKNYRRGLELGPAPLQKYVGFFIFGGFGRWFCWKILLGLQSRLPCTDPKSGLRPEMGKKWPKNGFWPHRKKGEKMDEKWQNCRFLPIFGPFFPLFSGGAKIHFSAIFSHFGPEARFGVCTGQPRSQFWALFPTNMRRETSGDKICLGGF